jgi:glutaconate CoA-transferase subunit B
MSSWTRDEMMTVAAARRLWDGCVCFVGIGLPSAACNLARLTHAPDIVLIYESGAIGTRPDILPLSIGDGELAETALCVVPLPEVFSYLLQAGRIDIGFLGAAQVDRFGNLNTTVIGPYRNPRTRLPGAGGAPEIAAHARQTFVVMRASKRSFVEQLDFRTSAGFLEGGNARAATSACGAGPQAVITDFGVLTPAAETNELTLAALFPDATAEEARAAVGWDLAVAGTVDTIAAPTDHELSVLRALNARTDAAHRRPVEIPA